MRGWQAMRRATVALSRLVITLLLIGGTTAFFPPAHVSQLGWLGGRGCTAPHARKLWHLGRRGGSFGGPAKQHKRGLSSLRCEVKISGNDQFLVANGAVSIALLMINRLATVELAAAQSRVDLLGIAVAAVMLLTAFARAEIQAREKESVRLAGVMQDEVDSVLGEGSQMSLRWAGQALMKAAGNVKSVAVVYKGKTLLRQGIMGRSQTVKLGPIVESACAKGDQAYLADLQILPGRFEFTYLPANTQAVVIQPFGEGSALIVGSDRIRGFTALDLTMVPSITRLVEQAVEAS